MPLSHCLLHYISFTLKLRRRNQPRNIRDLTFDFGQRNNRHNETPVVNWRDGDSVNRRPSFQNTKNTV